MSRPVGLVPTNALVYRKPRRLPSKSPNRKLTHYMILREFFDGIAAADAPTLRRTPKP